jgi:hypothetical protein
MESGAWLASLFRMFTCTITVFQLVHKNAAGGGGVGEGGIRFLKANQRYEDLIAEVILKQFAEMLGYNKVKKAA